MKSIIINLDYQASGFKFEFLRDLAVSLGNETCAKGFNCSFTGDLIDCSLRISLSLISGEEFTYNCFIDIVTLVKDIFEKKNSFLIVKSVSSF